MDRFCPSLIAFTLASIVALSHQPIGAAEASRRLTVPVREQERADAKIIEEVEFYSNSYALVIGIDKYGRGWAPLSNAIGDATRIASVMERQGFEVTLVKNPSSSALEKKLEDFFIDKGRDPEARLFVWYAGHGHTLDGEGYLIPSDGVAPSDEGRFLRTAISLRDFGKFVRLAKSKHVYTIFDSCFAGTIFNVARAVPPPAITRITAQPVRQFLTSGDAGQRVSDDGTFATLFIEALDKKRRADGNGDGFLTASEIGSFLAYEIANLTNNLQTPRHGKLRSARFNRGDFVFALPAPEKTEPSPQEPQLTAEILFWQSVQRSKNADAFEAYLAQFPDGTFAQLAKVRLEAINRQVVEQAAALDAERNRLAAERAQFARESERIRLEQKPNLEKERRRIEQERVALREIRQQSERQATEEEAQRRARQVERRQREKQTVDQMWTNNKKSVATPQPRAPERKTASLAPKPAPAPNPDGPLWLSAAQIELVFSGNQATTTANGNVIVIKFGESGELEGQSDSGRMDWGKWWVVESGDLFCRTWDEWDPQRRCTRVKLLGNTAFMLGGRHYKLKSVSELLSRSR
jgi:hypothetical protein